LKDRVKFDHFRRLFGPLGVAATAQGTVIERRASAGREFLFVVLDEPLLSSAGDLITSLWVSSLWVTEG
jgi:hypothetical protein